MMDDLIPTEREPVARTRPNRLSPAEVEALGSRQAGLLMTTYEVNRSGSGPADRDVIAVLVSSRTLLFISAGNRAHQIRCGQTARASLSP